MCGISGIISTTIPNHNRLGIVKSMNEAITHRGPNQDGFYSDEYCSLAMRRLSIIDLHTGKQPIFNEDKSLCIVFNGEIYNFQELRQTLIKKGHKFSTNSDTEVILHLYEEEKENTPSFLKGMFVFCIYNSKEKEWFFARDRFGEKPFFYHLQESTLSFSSEIQGLLKNSFIPRVLNLEVLQYYLAVCYTPEPNTLLKNIYTLRPGHFLKFKNGHLTTRPSFEINYN